MFLECTIPGCDKFLATGKREVGGILFLVVSAGFLWFIVTLVFCPLAKQKKRGEGIKSEPDRPKGES